MYGLEWVEQFKLGRCSGCAPLNPGAQHVPGCPFAKRVSDGSVHPIVWKLGATSLLTDISSEMVNSLLPVYIVLHLHLSPLQYGVIDGIYNGIAVALLGFAGGLLADKKRCQKQVAAAGYAVSAVCKLLLLAAGAAWGWITAITAADRIGKGVRTAPRDALISLHSSPESLARAFSVHRAMDASGALLGPLIAFALLAQLPGAYDAAWVTSFTFALLGLGVLWLFVQNPNTADGSPPRSFSTREVFRLLNESRFRSIAGVGVLLSVVTIADGFLYLVLQQRTGVTAGFFPLFYVATAGFYMLLSIPMGLAADRYGRALVLLSGYGVIGLIYAVLLFQAGDDFTTPILCLFLFGLYYAATEGVLMALASAAIPAELRTSGLAVLATAIGLGKMMSSLLFGGLWEAYGAQTASWVFFGAFIPSLLISVFWIVSTEREERAQ